MGYLKTCLHCKKEYSPKRKDQKYCKDSCRVSAHLKTRGVKIIQIIPNDLTIEENQTPFKREKGFKELAIDTATSAVGSGISNFIRGTATQKDLIEMEERLQKRLQEMEKRLLSNHYKTILEMASRALEKKTPLVDLKEDNRDLIG